MLLDDLAGRTEGGKIRATMHHASLPLGRRQALAYAAGLGLATVRPVTARPAPAVEALALPIKGGSSPGTWWLTQWFGNTTFAYRMRHSIYFAGQGLHFGIDFGMACGTEIIAAADGVVREIGGVRRAWPLHVAIDHPHLGITTIYGHLSRSIVSNIGDEVRRGEVIAESGDSVTHACNGSPHLHFEVRYDAMRVSTNPVPWVATDWPVIYAPRSEAPFEVDLSNPTRWQSIYDQPDVRFGGPYLNEFDQAWPPA